MSPPPSDNGSFVKADSFYPVDKEPVNYLFSDEKIIRGLGESRRADVAAKRASPTAGRGGVFHAEGQRFFNRLIDVALEVRSTQAVFTPTTHLDERPVALFLKLRDSG